MENEDTKAFNDWFESEGFSDAHYHIFETVWHAALEWKRNNE